MKRFNVSILAVVAVLAIGLTAFTKAEPVGKTYTVENCYRNLVPAYVGECTFSSFTLQPGITCSATVQAQLNKGLSATPTNFQATIQCGDLDNFFCCAELVIDETPCLNPPVGVPVQPAIDFTDEAGTPQVAKRARISAIHCKSTNL